MFCFVLVVEILNIRPEPGIEMPRSRGVNGAFVLVHTRGVATEPARPQQSDLEGSKQLACTRRAHTGSWPGWCSCAV